MSTDLLRRRRKPFTAKLVLAYFMALTGLATTVALPIVLFRANQSLNEQNVRMIAKDDEIKLLRAENLKAIERENELREKYAMALSARTMPEKKRSGQAAAVPDPADPEVIDRSKATTDASFGKSSPLLAKPLTQNGGDYPGSFATKLAQLHEKVVGNEMRHRVGYPDDFESRLTRLHEKVVTRDLDP